MPSQVNETFTFQDPMGNALAGGTITLRLNQDASAAQILGPQISAGLVISGTLDINGSITIAIWPNSVLQPSGTVYFIKAYSAAGELAWQGQQSF